MFHVFSIYSSRIPDTIGFFEMSIHELLIFNHFEADQLLASLFHQR